MHLSLTSLMINAITFIITTLSLIILYKQKDAYFKFVKPYFIIGYIFLAITVFSISEIPHIIINQASSYALHSFLIPLSVTSFILSSLVLTISAVLVCNNSSIHSMFIAFFGTNKNKKQLNKLLLLYTVYALILIIIIWTIKPFDISNAATLFGNYTLVPIYHIWYSFSLISLFMFFLIYTVKNMMNQSSLVHSKIVSRTLFFIPILWSAIGILSIFSEIILLPIHIEIRDIITLSASILLLTAVYFNSESSFLNILLEESVNFSKTSINNSLFSKSLNISPSQFKRQKMLLEIDPLNNYDKIINDFVQETMINSKLALIISTSNTSNYTSLTKNPQVKLISLSSTVSSLSQGSSANEILVPQNDLSYTIHVINKTLKQNSDSDLSITFDNISQLIIIHGLKKTFKFLTTTLEFLISYNVTALFIINTDIDQKSLSVIKSLFSTQITQQNTNLIIKKGNLTKYCF